MEDPYLNTEIAMDRLYAEYLKYKSLIVALDFDDTVFDFHKKGHTYNNVIRLIQECHGLGFHICIFTGSAPETYPSIKQYMDDLGIKIKSINENAFPMPFGNHGKMYYNILLDDRAGLAESYKILKTVVDKIKNTL